MWLLENENHSNPKQYIKSHILVLKGEFLFLLK